MLTSWTSCFTILQGCSPPNPVVKSHVPPPRPPNSASWPSDLSTLHSLNISRTNFAKLQQEDKWLGPLNNYLLPRNKASVLTGLAKKDQAWIISTAKRSIIIGGLLMYSDEFMDDCEHYRVFVPSDSLLRKHFLRAYHYSPMGMYCGLDATHNCLSRDFYCRNISKHVRN